MGDARIIFVLAIFFCWEVLFDDVFANEIKLKQGTLKGSVNQVQGYKAYLGIPYASVLKRFQEAGPPPTWNGTLLANQGTIKCYQYSQKLKVPVGQKQCLVANVFTPICKDKQLLAVMVFIHGGGFYFDSNTDLVYNPKFLVQKGVIVVTVNYRLGAFGFLCLHRAGAPGNIGFKDQVAALQWVKDNIQAFGGNPNSITVFGQSAGASSIHYIITSGKYKGLFNKAILQSGSVLGPNKIDMNPIETASFVASKMGFQTDDPNVLLKIFQNATVSDILKASQVDSKNQPLKSYIYRPCVENPIEKQSLVTKNPRQLVESKLDPDLKIIMGYNDKEGITYAGKYDRNGIKQLNNTISTLIPENLKFTDESAKETLMRNIRKFYFKKGIDYNSLIDLFSDTMIIYPSIVSTKFFLTSNLSVYNYYFKYDSSRNYAKFTSGLPFIPGADHGDEQYYMFDPLIYNFKPPKHSDLYFIHTLTTLWTNFAKTGDPTTCMIKWIQTNKDELQFLQLDKEIKMIPLPNKNRFLFWDRVYKEYTSY